MNFDYNYGINQLNPDGGQEETLRQTLARLLRGYNDDGGLKSSLPPQTPLNQPPLPAQQPNPMSPMAPQHEFQLLPQPKVVPQFSWTQGVANMMEAFNGRGKQEQKGKLFVGPTEGGE